MEGLLAIDEFKMAFDLTTLPGDGSYQTVGGFMVYMVGDTPAAGADFTWKQYRFEVVDMDERRIDKVLIAPTGEFR